MHKYYANILNIIYKSEPKNIVKFKAGPMGFDPTVCGSEDRRDVLTTLRTLLVMFIFYRVI